MIDVLDWIDKYTYLLLYWETNFIQIKAKLELQLNVWGKNISQVKGNVCWYAKTREKFKGYRGFIISPM